MINLENTINQAENGHPKLCKFIRLRLNEDNPNIGLSDKDQEFLEITKSTRLYSEEEIKISNSTSKSIRVFNQLQETCYENTSC
jgi:hypothetical protein